MTLNNIFSEITEKLDDIDRDREDILKISREIVRHCSIAIKSIHRKEFDVYRDKIKEIKSNHENLLTFVKKHPMLFSGYIKTPEQEYMEAVCLYAIINDQELPSPTDYNVDSVNYLLGLADVIGELRRHILDKIRRDEIDDLEKVLDTMSEIYSHLFAIDYPKGITQDLRRKTDVARGIIEKTRGDISLSLQINRLNKNLINQQK